MLDPEKARVVVVECDGEIVGCHILLFILHAECLWIAEHHRGKVSVQRALWSAVQAEATSVGASAIMTASVDEKVDRLLKHVGAKKVEADHYMIPLKSSRDRRDEKVGARFHRQLDKQLIHDNHPSDPDHNREVGKALRIGIAEGRIDDAVSGYNAWAAVSGYVPVTYAGMRDGQVMLDMQTAIVSIGDDYSVRLIEERTSPCQP
jgi:hypothetical protein